MPLFLGLPTRWTVVLLWKSNLKSMQPCWDISTLYRQHSGNQQSSFLANEGWLFSRWSSVTIRVPTLQKWPDHLHLLEMSHHHLWGKAQGASKQSSWKPPQTWSCHVYTRKIPYQTVEERNAAAARMNMIPRFTMCYTATQLIIINGNDRPHGELKVFFCKNAGPLFRVCQT